MHVCVWKSDAHAIANNGTGGPAMGYDGMAVEKGTLELAEAMIVSAVEAPDPKCRCLSCPFMQVATESDQDGYAIVGCG